MTGRPLKKFYNAYDGERVFLIGNGPSLRDTPLKQLESEFTFGVNKIFRVFDQTNWRPDFYFSIFDPYDIKRWDGGKGIQEIESMANSGIECFLNATLAEIFGDVETIHYVERFSLHNDYVPFHRYGVDEIQQLPLDHLHEYWSDDISNLVYEYHSMYCMMQISAYLGFDEIYLVGCDLGFEYVDPHMVFEDGLDPYRYDGGKRTYFREAFSERKFLKSVMNGIAFKLISRTSNYNTLIGKVFDGTRGDHFDSGYWEDRLKIQDGPKLEAELRKGHVAARRICEDLGINVFNATLGGELDVYERRDLTDLL